MLHQEVTTEEIPALFATEAPLQFEFTEEDARFLGEYGIRGVITDKEGDDKKEDTDKEDNSKKDDSGPQNDSGPKHDRFIHRHPDDPAGK